MSLISFFTNTAPELARKIPTISRTFESFLNKRNITMSTDSITMNELKEDFFSLKRNKSPGYDEIGSNVIINWFSELNDPLKYLFENSIERGVFPDAFPGLHFLNVEILVISVTIDPSPFFLVSLKF